MVHRLMLKRVLSLSLPVSSSLSLLFLSSSVLPAARQISTTSRKSTVILSSSLSSSFGFCVKSRANNSNNSNNIGIGRGFFSTATITTTVNAISTATATATVTNNNSNINNNINNNSNNTKMPGPPYQYHRRQNNQHGGTSSSSRPDAVVLDLFELNQTLLNSHQKRNETFDKSRKIQLALVQVRSDIEDSGGGGGGVQGRAAHDQAIVESIRQIQDSLVEAIETSTTTTTATKEEGDGTTTTNTRLASRVPRDANLNQRVEELCRLMAYHHFLTTPTSISTPTSTDSDTGDTGIHLLLPPSKLVFCHKQQLVVKNNITITDEEYLAGACMGLCQDLSHYAMGRATARDIESVQQARDVVSSILDYLLTFDFRNGFLRRKYDGTKYQLKSLETLLYELSVTGCTTTTSTTSTSTVSSSSSTATAAATDTTAAINSASISTYAVEVEEELTALHQRMEHRDQLRETLIKKCREGQKMAKQAIYALHRKDYSKAQGLITNCETWIVQELTPIVQEEPPLRYGSYAAVMEEYVEAKLFYVWLVGKETNEENNTNNMDMDIEPPSSVSVSSSVQQAGEGGGGGGATGQLLLPHEFCSQIHLEPVEYLGGLCDLTGEIGRYAVQRGTARDYDGVGLCLESNSVILNAIVLLERAPPSINKKMEQLRKSVTKIKRMTYEMSLSQAAGMNMTTSATTETEDNNNKNNNNDTE